LDAVSVKSEKAQIKVTLRQHLDRLEQIPVFRESIKVFVPENNLANEGSHMWNMIKNYPKVREYRQKDVTGVHKGPGLADHYQYMFNVKLKNNAVLFDSEFFTTSRTYERNSIKALLREQLERYHFGVDEPKSEGKEGKQYITGKMGTTGQDDLAIVVLMGVFWGPVVLKNPRKIIY
jgi:hypothetical protein